MPLTVPLQYRYPSGTVGQPATEHQAANTFFGTPPVYFQMADGSLGIRPASGVGTGQSNARGNFPADSKFGQFTGVWQPLSAPAAACTPMLGRSNNSPVIDLLWNTNMTARIREVGNTTTFTAVVGERYLVQAAVSFGSGTTGGRRKGKVTRLSDGVVLYDFEGTGQDLSAHSTMNYFYWGKGTSGAQDMGWDDVTISDQAYEFLAPLGAAASSDAGLGGTSTLTVAGDPWAGAAAMLSGSSSLTAAGSPTSSGLASLGGTTTLAAAAAPAAGAPGALSGSTALSAQRAPAPTAGADLSGTTTLAAVGANAGGTTAALTGASTLTVTTRPAVARTASLTGLTTLTAAAASRLATDTTLVGTTVLQIAGRPGPDRGVVLAGATTLTAVGHVVGLARIDVAITIGPTRGGPQVVAASRIGTVTPATTRQPDTAAAGESRTSLTAAPTRTDRGT